MESYEYISRSRRSCDRFSTSSLRKSCSPMRNISGVVTREPTAAATALRSGRCAIEYKTTAPSRGRKREGGDGERCDSTSEKKEESACGSFHETETGIRVKSGSSTPLWETFLYCEQARKATAKSSEKGCWYSAERAAIYARRVSFSLSTIKHATSAGDIGGEV